MKVQPWAAATAAFAAGTIAAVGIAQATSAPTKIPDSSTGVITACFVKKTGAVRFINAQAGKTCKSGEKQVTFNQKGVQGPTGATGATGATGERGPSDTYVKRATGGFLGIGIPVAGANVATLTLPAGDYLVNAQTSFFKFNDATTQVFCELRSSAGTVKGTPAFWFPKPDAAASNGAAIPVTLTGTLEVAPADTALHLYCKATGDDSIAFGGAVLTATKVAKVTVQ